MVQRREHFELVNWAAAAAFAGACAFAQSAVLIASGAGGVAGPAAVATSALAFAAAHCTLQRAGPPRRSPLPGFVPPPMPAFDGTADELLLTNVHREPVEELLLDQPVEQDCGDARVVRLFGRGRPQHSPAPAEDASAALREALLALRSSLRG